LAAASKTAGPQADVYRDYRYVIERKDIDGVVIATPDHWHGVQTVHAAECGKHVYVEKPRLLHDRRGKGDGGRGGQEQGRRAVGSQGRSQPDCHAAITYLRNGCWAR